MSPITHPADVNPLVVAHILATGALKERPMDSEAPRASPV
jgi:hypothetical protein